MEGSTQCGSHNLDNDDGPNHEVLQSAGCRRNLGCCERREAKDNAQVLGARLHCGPEREVGLRL